MTLRHSVSNRRSFVYIEWIHLSPTCPTFWLGIRTFKVWLRLKNVITVSFAISNTPGGRGFVSELKLKSTSSTKQNFPDEITGITWKKKQSLEICLILFFWIWGCLLKINLRKRSKKQWDLRTPSSQLSCSWKPVGGKSFRKVVIQLPALNFNESLNASRLVSRTR